MNIMGAMKLKYFWEYFYFNIYSIQIFQYFLEYAITCSEHEVFDECVNACPPTCRRPNPTPCPSFTCSKGCSCKPGLILNEDTGLCVPPEKCRKGMWLAIRHWLDII